jgi:hypothetical protein
MVAWHFAVMIYLITWSSLFIINFSCKNFDFYNFYNRLSYKKDKIIIS